MSAREEILARVRAGIGQRDHASRRAAAEAYLRAGTRGPQPVLTSELVARFQARAESLSSTVEQVGCDADVPSRVAAYLRQHGVAASAVTTHELAALNWAGAGIAVSARCAVDADTTGISGCFCAIAETGTLMLLSSPATPATVSLLPETHIALVPVGRIVATMEEAFSLLRAEQGSLPRAVNFISGPSRTGDIEQTIVLGAHGPCRVHLILIGETA